MTQIFSRPDMYFSKCGNFKAAITHTRIPHSSAFMKGVRALFISDVHFSRRKGESSLDSVLEQWLQLSPDILFLGGDYADDAENSMRFIEALRCFSCPLGVYAVLGNNDREAWADTSILRLQMEKSNIRLLVNESVEIPLGEGRLFVAGVDDHKYGNPDVHGLYSDGQSNVYRILLSHYPCMPTRIPDLQLSGHTHGGQFNFLGITPYTIGFERITHRERAPEVIAGLKKSDNGYIFVSKGIGSSRIPLRVGVRPEVNLLYF